MQKVFKGFVSYKFYPDCIFLSDSEPTLKKIIAKYENADVDGYIDLSKIPIDAFLKHR